MMELRQIECFLAVAEQLNFTRAAETLYISQPALSKQITRLEQEIGVQLFARKSRGIELTPAGTALYHAAERIFEAIDDAVKLARQAENASGTLRIAVEEGFSICPEAQKKLTSALLRLRKSEELLISIKDISSSEIVDQLQDQEIDLGFSLLPEQDSSSLRFYSRKLTYLPIHRDEMVMLISKYLPDWSYKDNYDTQEIRTLMSMLEVCVPRNDLRILSHVIRLFAAYDVRPKIRYTDSRIDSRLLTQLGMCSIFGPEQIAINENMDLHVVRMDSPETKMEYCAIYSEHNQNPLVLKLLEYL